MDNAEQKLLQSGANAGCGSDISALQRAALVISDQLYLLQSVLSLERAPLDVFDSYDPNDMVFSSKIVMKSGSAKHVSCFTTLWYSARYHRICSYYNDVNNCPKTCICLRREQALLGRLSHRFSPKSGTFQLGGCVYRHYRSIRMAHHIHKTSQRTPTWLASHRWTILALYLTIK